MCIIIQLIAATLGTLGFCLVFNIGKKHMLVPTVGGGLCWGVYLLAIHYGCSVFIATILAAAFVGIYGRIFANLYNLPTTIYFIPACVPLIPGSNLYYTLTGLLASDWAIVEKQATLLILYTFGIAIGLTFIMEITHIIYRIKKRLS